VRIFVVRQVLCEVVDSRKQESDKPLNALIPIAMGPQLNEGMQLVTPFRLNNWAAMRVGKNQCPVGQYEQGCLTGNKILGENVP
jgi:hypothetical protein